MSHSSEVSGRNVCYVVSNELVKISSLLPSNKGRSLLVHSLVKAFGLFSMPPGKHYGRLVVVKPFPADYKDLSVYHSRDYLDHILSPSTSSLTSDVNSEYGLEEDCPYFTGLPEYVRLVAAASLAATDALCQGHTDISICWDGGRHHAHKSYASGFCYVADCVLAVLSLKRGASSMLTLSSKPRVMYLDLDLHFSDGVSQAFASSSSGAAVPQILTLSIHHAAPGFFPVSPLSALPDPSSPSFNPFVLSMPLARGASNTTFARIWPTVERVKDAFQPNFVVVQCGVDGLAGDPCAIWNWSLGGVEGSLGWCIERICHEWNCKTLLLGGGGYNSSNVARAWTYLTSIALGSPIPLESDIPDHDAFPLYAPSFTLDVPSGTMQDQNTEKYLSEVEECFSYVAGVIEKRLSSILEHH
ncbi:Histone deacetylase phd1 [Sparassis crispa]|uniref:Histone deacetylase 8 n=1 Tax=Sparassis crispa TaxID=139825 RepID=A0A401GZU1_9APHY|nr:Histone deacetylase phd1 [Sparassis crispa]GBE87672.1 Histone deacetylase phd1 [Sparassis crispa]